MSQYGAQEAASEHSRTYRQILAFYYPGTTVGTIGIPTIRGATRADVARATGFLHAQDRFFQMDLARRRAAGEARCRPRTGGGSDRTRGIVNLW